MGILKGKKALIVGLASQRSIAYGIAKIFHEQGAELAFSYQNEKLESRVKKLAEDFGRALTFSCDVASDEEINKGIGYLKEQWGQIDILIHSVAFAPADQISGDFIEHVNREGFQIAQDISAYSLLALSKAILPFMSEEGSILTLSYYGAEKVVPNYNVMGVAKASLEASLRYLANSVGPRGIRANAISAGPIKTLAAAGIKDFRKMQTAYADITPLRRNISAEEVGKTAAFLCSDWASGITGEVVHVDAGFHILGLAL